MSWPMEGHWLLKDPILGIPKLGSDYKLRVKKKDSFFRSIAKLDLIKNIISNTYN